MKAEAAESFEAPLGDVGRIGDVSRHLSSAPLYNIMLIIMIIILIIINILTVKNMFV